MQWIQDIVFQGKHKLLKNPGCKNYIQYSENFSENSVFRASASSSKILKIKIFQCSEEFQGKLYF